MLLFIQGGGIDSDQCAHGKVALFNIWNYLMTESQLNRIECGEKGNVVSMSTLKMQGTMDSSYRDFPCTGDMLCVTLLPIILITLLLIYTQFRPIVIFTKNFLMQSKSFACLHFVD